MSDYDINFSDGFDQAERKWRVHCRKYRESVARRLKILIAKGDKRAEQLIDHVLEHEWSEP